MGEGTRDSNDSVVRGGRLSRRWLFGLLAREPSGWSTRGVGRPSGDQGPGVWVVLTGGLG